MSFAGALASLLTSILMNGGKAAFSGFGGTKCQICGRPFKRTFYIVKYADGTKKRICPYCARKRKK